MSPCRVVFRLDSLEISRVPCKGYLYMPWTWTPGAPVVRLHWHCLPRYIVGRPLRNVMFVGARYLHARTFRLRITACTVCVYASRWSLPSTPQDSIPGLNGFSPGRTFTC